MSQQQQKYTWVPMTTNHLTTVLDIADVCYPDYPEEMAIFEDKLSKFPAGCFVLQAQPSESGATGGEIVGYAFSHPWYHSSAPSLNKVLPNEVSTLTPTTNPNAMYYLHDCAIHPKARGTGGPTTLVPMLDQIAVASNFPYIALIAVNNSQAFWEKQGFQVVDKLPAALKKTLISYSDDALYMVRSLSARL